ncbi:ABC transporter substrate-binding protein [Rhodoligotrophos appendicifer]|uniref:ABC transporter substrate-binding protein n=1 Tax=Rhodoligotrophos appendicifer TaxID=987056 RepID=UPI00319DB7A0
MTTVPGPAAQASSAAETLIGNFHAGLLSTMKQGASLGYAGRAQRLAPLVRRTFGLQTMARLIVGSQWGSLSASERRSIEDAFAKWVIANYASRFDSWGGESFVTDGVTDGGRQTVIVNTQIVPQGVKLGYRVLNGRVIDVYLSGSISQLAQWRSEFGAVLQQQGPKGLVARLEAGARQLSQ